MSDPYRDIENSYKWVQIGESLVKISKIDAIFVRVTKKIYIVKVLVDGVWIYAINKDIRSSLSKEEIKKLQKRTVSEANRIKAIIGG